MSPNTALKKGDQRRHRVRFAMDRIKVDRDFARTAVAPEVVEARNAFLVKTKLVQSESIGNIGDLLAQIAKEHTALQKMCKHELVFSYPGARGIGYDEGTCGHRICTICNLREYSQKAGEDDVYTNLVENKTRLVRRDLRGEKGSIKTEWLPIEFLRELFQ